MNTRIIDAIGYIDDKFIKEALDMSDEHDSNTKSKSRKPLFIGGACTIAAAVIAGVFISRSGIIGQSGEHYTSDSTSVSQTGTSESTPENPPESTPASTPDNSDPVNSEPEPSGTPETQLPYNEFAIDYDNLPFEYTAPDELTPINSGLAATGMGYEGFHADDISDYAERNSHNPWNPSLEINELPIFTTKYGAYASMVSATLDKDEAMTKLEEIAAALGGELSHIELNEVQLDHYDPTYADELEGKLLSARASVGYIDVHMHSLSSIQIVFGDTFQIPDGYGIDDEIYDSETQDKTAKYFIDKYPELFGIENPTTYFDDSYRCAYDYSDNAFEAILNYNFNLLRFYESNTDGVGLWIDDVLADYECGGFYPVITPEKAREELLAGNYVTTVVDERYIPDGVNEDNTEDYCELVYRMNSDRSAYIPYYKFIVRLHDEIGVEMNGGGNSYGIFLVPAVEREYLTDMEFNPKFN